MNLLALIILVGVFQTAAAQPSAVLWVEVNGYISPGTAAYVEEAFAEASRYSAVLVTLDTLGGQADAMLRIVESIQRSPVPVIGFVYPVGGKAMSAGTYILMASNFAAMSPGTLIGSAQPVAGGEPVTDSKVLNFFAEKMGSLAEANGRNREEAVKIVLENKNFNPQSAMEAGLIEAVANSVDELLEQADGKTVMTFWGERVLNVKGASVVRKSPSLTATIVSMLSDPLLSSVLITLGILLVVFGLSSPGWGGEVMGILLVILGLVGQGLNINIAGALLVIVGAVLMLYELLSPGFGIVGIGGILCLTLGMILIGGYPPTPAFVAQEWFTQFQTTVIMLALFMAAFLGFLGYKSYKAQRRRPIELSAKHARAVERIETGRVGYIVIEGEYWRAKAVRAVEEGQSVKIVGREDGVFVVEPEEPT
ncbi:MAG: nodulation protein NfeD [Candidatus Caldarchaeum sp.]